MDQIGFTNIYRTFHPKSKEYTFFSAPYGTYSKIDHIIGHKTDLNRYKKIELLPCFLSDHYGLMLIINEGTTYTSLWNAMKAVLRRKHIALSATKMKLERAYTSSFTEHLKTLEHKEANTHKMSIRQ